MNPKFLLALCLLLSSAVQAVAEDKGAGTPNGPGAAADTAPAASTASGAAAAPVAAAPTPAAAAPAAKPAAPATGAPEAGDQAKTLRGMAVLGNNEAPMSLFIVPWKSSELGTEADLHRTLDERPAPVDRDVLLREVEFYQVSAGGKK